MRRESTVDNSDSESVSSEESRGRHGEFLSRASHMFAGLGRGIRLLKIQPVEEGPRNDLQERFLEAKQSNLFVRRGSDIYSDASGIDEESISDASTFEMPTGEDCDVGSCDDTGGMQQNDAEPDIDRLQLEIHAPCAHIQTHEKQLVRALSGVTLGSLSPPGSSKKKIDRSIERPSILGPLPFFRKGYRGLSNRSSNSDDSLNRDVISHTDTLRHSWKFVQPDETRSSREEAARKRRSALWRQGNFLNGSAQNIEKKDDHEIDEVAAKEREKAKAAAKLMHKHFQTANNPQSFRNLQKRMKDNGAVTGSGVRALLQNIELGSSISFDSEDSMGLELDRSAKDKFFKTSESRAASQRTIITQQESDFDIQCKKNELQQRLRGNPLYSEMEPRPYIRLPSREPSVQFLTNLILCSTDEGKTSFITLHGEKYLGKSKLIDRVVECCQAQSYNSFTVLKSERSANTTMNSFYPFRQIISSALRKYDERMNMLGEQLVHDDIDEHDARESVSSIVKRLVERQVLNKSDQLMISRMLPDTMLDSRDLLSLLEGRSPIAITKDTTATIFKLMIPIQPVLLVFDAADGVGELDASSWDLLEHLTLSSHASCPQMIPILISREKLTIPKSLIDVRVDIRLSAITKSDSEEYIRALFDPGCLDKEMVVDEQVLDCVHSRAQGCPLFLELLILWAQKKELIEIDETNVIDGQSELTNENVLPSNLYEEVLTEINKLAHNELDSLKIACCMGMIFSPETYKALKVNGLFDILDNLKNSHRLFYLNSDRSFRWRHSVVFDAISSIIISDERQEIHERICESISKMASTSCDVQHARHYFISRRLDEAWDRYMDAGKQSEKVYDYAHAVQCYNQAKCSRRKRSSLREKIACSTALGWSLQALERYDEAEKELESSLEWTMTLPEDERHEEYSLLTALAKVKTKRSKHQEGIDLYERALPLVDTNAHSAKWLAHHISSYAEILRKVIPVCSHCYIDCQLTILLFHSPESLQEHKSFMKKRSSFEKWL